MRARRSVAAALGFAAVLLTATPANAEIAVDARAAVLSESASCALGDIEIHYTGGGVERQRTNFTAADGRELHRYDTRVYASSHEGVEYILSQTRTPPEPGTVVAVHVTIGASPPDAQTGEFLVAYRCDTMSNDAGGNNEVVSVCTGMFGSCPTTAKQVIDGVPIATSSPVVTSSPSSPSPPPPAVVRTSTARTGADVVHYLLVAGLLLLVGTILVAAVRRRRRHPVVGTDGSP